MNKEKRKIGWREAIIQLCLCVTCIALVWTITFPLYQDKGVIADFFFSTLFGIGAIGFYIPIGVQVRKGFDFISKLDSSKNSEANK